MSLDSLTKNTIAFMSCGETLWFTSMLLTDGLTKMQPKMPPALPPLPPPSAPLCASSYALRIKKKKKKMPYAINVK